MLRKQSTFGFHWVLADRLMMGLKVQPAPGHTLSSVSLTMGSAPLPSTDCQNRGDRRSHQKQCGTLLCTRKKINTKDVNPEHAATLMFCKLDFFAFLPHPNSDKSSQLFQMFWFLSAQPIPAEYGPVKTSPRRFHVESGLCCTAVKVRQEEEICCKSATSWQLSGCTFFYSETPGVILLLKWLCKNLLAFNSEKSMMYH